MQSTRQARGCAPVFVVGSARSGTTLLYDMLLSAGDFALYLGESNIFNLLAPRFGNLGSRQNRERMFEVWAGSSLFRISGLDRQQIERPILEDCRNPGDFLRIVMDAVARQQGARRWAGNAPEEILHLRQIKQTIPEALIIHMIRDGRDVSLSLSQKNYIRPFPWKKRETPEGTSLYWQWIVGKGRAASAFLGRDYTEVRFEELIADPRPVLRRLSEFLEQDLDYDTIQRNAVGAVARPNTSFKRSHEATFNPVGRWKKQFTKEQLSRIEGLVGNTLMELGYELASTGVESSNRLYVEWNRMIYRQFFELKLHSKTNAILRILRSPLSSKFVDSVSLVDEKTAARIRIAGPAAVRSDLGLASQGTVASQPQGGHV
jgi:hypothetical protein